MGFPWTRENVMRTLSSVGGTVAALHSVMKDDNDEKKKKRASAHVAGGTHHAFKVRGEGFCIFSDIAGNVCCQCIIMPHI